MSPKRLMICGAVGGLMLLVAGIIGVLPPGVALVLFGFGALFGKGYGVWEERSRLPRPHPQEDKP